MFFVCYQVFDLFYHLVFKVANNIQTGTFGIEEKGRPIAGIFFNVLLLLEIIQTIKVFAHDHSVKLKIILIVGLIAVTRSILMLEIDDEHHTLSEFAIASLILALSIGYYLVSKSEQIGKTD